MRQPCQRCGQCLSRCIYLRLTQEEAAIEMRRLDEGRDVPHITSRCVSCAACNVFCPHGADPYGRILERWYADYLRDGLPERARYLMPTEAKSFRTDLLRRLPADERVLVERWATNEPAGETLYPGCNLISSAYLTQSGVFDGLTIAGNLDVCCGEMYYRMGLFDQARLCAERVAEYYAGRKIERLVMVCPAGYNMFTHVYPERFGIRFDFPLVYVVDYLNELLDDGVLQVTRPLRRKVVMHDSCHARLLGDEFLDGVRALLHRLGVETTEARYQREEGLCCGIAAAAPRQSPIDLAKVALWAHREYAKTSGEQVATYCTGCYLTLGMLRPPLLGLPVTHLLALVAEAIGRPVADRLGPRTRSMFAGVARHALPKLLSRRRFYVR